MSLLPPNATKLERAVESAASLDLPTPLADLWHPATCPEAALPWLAWALHLSDSEGWALARTSPQKRALLSQAAALHRKKGTPAGIQSALLAAGFQSIDLQERLPQNRYDGSLNHAGDGYYNAYGWAQFRATADAGDDQPISAADTALLVQTINEWKPARCHLVDVQYRAGVTESVASTEYITTASELALSEPHLWGRRLYDGSLIHNQGMLRTHDGAFAFSGAASYTGFTAAGERYDAERETDSTAGSLALGDVQSRGPLFDGFGDYGGSLDFGATAPVAEDPPMPIVLTRQRRYDGRHAFAANRHDGTRLYTGGFAYFGNIPYSGDVLTHLEA